VDGRWSRAAWWWTTTAPASRIPGCASRIPGCASRLPRFGARGADAGARVGSPGVGGAGDGRDDLTGGIRLAGASHIPRSFALAGEAAVELGKLVGEGADVVDDHEVRIRVHVGQVVGALLVQRHAEQVDLLPAGLP